MKAAWKKGLIAGMLCAMLPMAAIGCANKNDNSSPSPSASPSASTTQSAQPSPSEEPAKLKIMFQKGTDPDIFYNWMQENIKLYKEKHPKTEFEIIANTVGDQYQTVLTTEMAANNVPDIFQGWTMERMKPFVEADRLLDLSEALNADPAWKDFVMAEPLKATTFGGGIYGIPTTLDTEIIYYNKNVFDKYNLQPPQTYDELLQIVDVLKSNGITPITLGNKESWMGTIHYMMIAERIGGLDMYQSVVMDKTAPWTSDPLVEAGKKLQELMAKGAFEKDVNSVSASEMYAKFSEGKAAMYAGGSWDIPGVTGALQDQFGFFNFPDIPGGKGSKDHYIIIPNSSLSISKDTKYKEQAIDFLKFVFSQERQEAFAKLGFLAATKVQVNAADVNPVSYAVQQALSSATGTMYPWDVPMGAALGKELSNMTQALYMGEDPLKQLEALQKKQDNLSK